MTTKYAIEIQHLRYEVKPHFWSHSKPILHDVNMQVERGEVVGFLGPNGAGKTTTIKALLGLLQPNAGQVRVLDASPRRSETRRQLGYMPERAYFPEELTAGELLELHTALAGLEGDEAKRRTDEALERVGLTHAKNERLRAYSKGMLQRAGLAQALVGDPELVLLDEPMSGLDPIGRRDIREIMLSLRDQGKTVFFSTHILPDVEMICDRAVIIARGRTRRIGTLDSLLGEAVDRVDLSADPCDDETLQAAMKISERHSSRSSSVTFHLASRAKANELVDLLRARRVEIHELQTIRRSLEDLFVDEAVAADQPREDAL